MSGQWRVLVPRFAPCPPEARIAALEVLYRRVPDALRYRLIAEVLNEATRGEIDLSGLWVACDRTGRVIGALLTQPLAGKAAAVWAPEVRPSWRRPSLSAALLHAALADLKARGFRLAQAVLDESAGLQAARDLTKGGLPRVTDLLYLERETAVPLPSRGSEPSQCISRDCSFSDYQFEWQPFGASLEAEFRTVLQDTYVGSLDMPELEGARALDDIMEGHRAAGRFNAELWCLGHIRGKPSAASVLLMAEVPGRDVWEVVYLGLTPAARGHGLGRVVLQHALELARQHVSRLELAVDCRNIPATRLYHSTGFVVRDRRAVHLAILA